MDRMIRLCWDCRQIFKDHYEVEVYDYDNYDEKKNRGCENCSKKYDIKLCRLKGKKYEAL